MGNEALAYEPQKVTPPGDSLLDVLEERGMTQADLAERMGHSRKMVNEIIKGLAPITAETAIQLERVLGAPASFWINRERHYREYLARKDEEKRLKGQAGWLRGIPVAAMAKQGWIPKTANKVETLRAVLNFFGVASPEQWESVWQGPQAAFRKSQAFESEPGAVAAWLRKGELDAAKLRCGPYDASGFKEALIGARGLTREAFPSAFAQLQNSCATRGVAVVLTPEMPGSRASGATRWLTAEKALVQLSLRYRKDDQFWFTFFHEAGHVLLHGKRLAFLEAKGIEANEMEAEANRFAERMLIPEGEWLAFQRANPGKLISALAVERFAERIGIAPGIVAGRLQHTKRIPPSHLNALRRTLERPEPGAL